jgi:hypothetical protein
LAFAYVVSALKVTTAFKCLAIYLTPFSPYKKIKGLEENLLVPDFTSYNFLKKIAIGLS